LQAISTAIFGSVCAAAAVAARSIAVKAAQVAERKVIGHFPVGAMRAVADLTL
jgi:hypothetical protein